MHLFDAEGAHDPLANNVLEVDDAPSFVPINTERYFQLDYSQYIELIRASYVTTNVVDKDFGQNISFGMFQYYCVLLLWMRLYFILSERGLKVTETLELKNVLNFTLPVPTDISLYLQGIGNLRDITGNEYLIDIQGTLSNLDYLNAQGSYGKASASNLIIYETLPSLLISLLKIRADLALDSGGDLDWNLPASLRLEPASTPTRNLLGWWPAEKLTSQQKTILTNARMTTNRFTVVNIGFLPVNALLVKSTAEKLQKSHKSYDVMPSSRYGSIAQVAFTSRSTEDANVDRMENIAGKLGRTNSYIQMPNFVAKAAATFRYRLKRYEKGLFDMVGYVFIQNNTLNEILQRENQIFDYGVGSELWQRSDYRISEQNGRSLVNSLSKQLRDISKKLPSQFISNNNTYFDSDED